VMAIINESIYLLNRKVLGPYTSLLFTVLTSR
jgi:hypothetical protein